MKECLICHTMLKEDNNFCKNCGVRISQMKAYNQLITQVVKAAAKLIREEKPPNKEETKPVYYDDRILGILRNSNISMNADTLHVVTGIDKRSLGKRLVKLTSRNTIKKTTKKTVNYYMMNRF